LWGVECFTRGSFWLFVGGGGGVTFLITWSESLLILRLVPIRWLLFIQQIHSQQVISDGSLLNPEHEGAPCCGDKRIHLPRSVALLDATMMMIMMMTIIMVLLLLLLLLLIIIQFFIYLRADSTVIGLLQSQHGHILVQQKQWTAQRQ
jgi:hypothetical protein